MAEVPAGVFAVLCGGVSDWVAGCRPACVMGLVAFWVGRDPERAARVRVRTAEALGRLDPWFPGDVATGVLGESLRRGESCSRSLRTMSLVRRLIWITGLATCYESRPILCRTFGPPMRTEEDNLATCELCYIGASTEEIERCELDLGDSAVRGREQCGV